MFLSYMILLATVKMGVIASSIGYLDCTGCLPAHFKDVSSVLVR